MNRRGVAVWGGLLGLAGCMGVVGAALAGTDGLQTSANVAQLVSVVLTVPALAVPLLLWSRRSALPVVTPEAVAAAKDVLALLVGQQWRAEAILRSLDDPDPIPVRWYVVADDRVLDHPANLTPDSLRMTASSDDITAMADQFRAMRRRRLVILGAAGTGKTTLAVQLLRELLATRLHHDDEPVPMLLSVAGWDTEAFPRAQDWLAFRLGQDYPALRATGLGAAAPAVLAENGQVLPVLDGLDELPVAAQAAVITALNRSLSSTDQFIVTARTLDYQRAVDAAGDVLTSALVIEPAPLDAPTVADYLRRCLPPRPAPAWEQIIHHLRDSPAPPASPIAALAEITATPLGLWLLRAVYVAPGADSAPLLDPDQFPDATRLRAHLFDQLIPALLATRPPTSHPADLFRPRRSHDPAQMRRRLSYLAHHLSHPRNPDGSPRTRDLAWWHLAHTTGAVTPAARLTLGLAITLTITLTAVVETGLANGLHDGMTNGLAYGLVFGLAAGLMVTLAARSWPQQSPGFADLRLRGHRPISASGLTAKLARGLMLGLGAGLVMTLSVGLQVAIFDGLLAGLTITLAVGLAWALSAALTAWAEAPTPTGQANTPLTNWRADRTLNLVRAATVGLTSGLTGGLTGGLTAGLTGGAANTTAFALAVGLTYGLAFCLAAGLGNRPPPRLDGLRDHHCPTGPNRSTPPQTYALPRRRPPPRPAPHHRPDLPVPPRRTPRPPRRHPQRTRHSIARHARITNTTNPPT